MFLVIQLLVDKIFSGIVVFTVLWLIMQMWVDDKYNVQ